MLIGWGTGIPKLFKEMKESGLSEPEFIDMENALRINLYRQGTGEEIETSEETGEEIETSEETSEETDEEIKAIEKNNEETGTRDKILEAITNDPMITQKELAKKVGLSYSGVRYAMKKLQEAGIIVRTGSTKNGKWEVCGMQ